VFLLDIEVGTLPGSFLGTLEKNYALVIERNLQFHKKDEKP